MSSTSEQNKPLLSSAILFGVTGMIFSALRIDLLWMLTSLLYTALIYWTSKIKGMEETKHGIFKWTPILLVLGISGISPYIGSFWLFGDLAFAALAPILGFIIILNLTCHTGLKTNLYFSSAFIFLFTLSAGGFSGIVRFFSYRYLNTTFLVSNYQLMNELLGFILVGILGTLLHIFFLNGKLPVNKSKLGVDEFKSEFIVSAKYFRSHFFKFLNSYFRSGENTSVIRSSRVFQISILALVVYNLAIENFWGYSISLISFILSIFTPIYSRLLDVKISPSFQFWISVALFLYASGESLRFQQILGSWNPFTHFIGGIIVGTLVIIYLFYLIDIFDNLHIPSKLIPIVVLTFILSISVLWEVFEFLIDSFLGTSLQPSLQNTVYDMIANTIGAFFALLLTNLITSIKVFPEIDRRDKKPFQKVNIIAYVRNIPILVWVMVCGVFNLYFLILRSDMIWSIISSGFIVLIFGISKFRKRNR